MTTAEIRAQARRVSEAFKEYEGLRRLTVWGFGDVEECERRRQRYQAAHDAYMEMFDDDR
jgi:hypothetical protein